MVEQRPGHPYVRDPAGPRYGLQFPNKYIHMKDETYYATAVGRLSGTLIALECEALGTNDKDTLKACISRAAAARKDIMAELDTLVQARMATYRAALAAIDKEGV